MSHQTYEHTHASANAEVDGEALQMRSMSPPSLNLVASSSDPGADEPEGSGFGLAQGKSNEQSADSDPDSPIQAMAKGIGTYSDSPVQLAEDPYADFKGKQVNKPGRISSPGSQYKAASTDGVNIREKPNGALPEIGKILYNSKVQVMCEDNTGAFYFIVPLGSGKEGWINKSFVAMDAPDSLANLHNIQEPNLISVLEKNYVDTGLWTLSTGNDYTTLAAAIQVANSNRLGVTIDWEKVEEYKDNNFMKVHLDPWMADNFAVMHGSDVVKGTNIWMPSVSYIRGLQSSGVIGSRPDWLNTAIDAGKGIAGFSAGLVQGIFEGLWEMVEGLWEIGKSIVNTVRGVLDGSLFTSMRELYDKLTNMSMTDVKEMVDTILTMMKQGWEDFKTSWNHPNMYDRWNFRGRIVGQVVLEVVLAIFTGGASLGAKVLLKVGAKFPKLARLLKGLLKVADKITPGNRKKPDAPDAPGRKPDGPDGDNGGKPRDNDNDQDRDDNDDMSKDDRAWEQTRAMAAMVTEGHDLKDTPVEELIAHLNSQFASRTKVVSGYKANPNGDGSYEVLQLARRKKKVDPHYTDRNDRRGATTHEDAGGHTIDRHVGRSDNWLRNRMAQNRGMDVASTFNNLQAANRAQGKFVKKFKGEIGEWLKGNEGRFTRQFDTGQPVGRCLRRGAAKSVDSSKVFIVIARNPNVPNGWHYVTAFPVP